MGFSVRVCVCPCPCPCDGTAPTSSRTRTHVHDTSDRAILTLLQGQLEYLYEDSHKKQRSMASRLIYGAGVGWFMGELRMEKRVGGCSWSDYMVHFIVVYIVSTTVMGPCYKQV